MSALDDYNGSFVLRFQYTCLYELDSLAVVNVRDLGGIKHAFKLLVFPETRLFQCANAPAKEVSSTLLRHVSSVVLTVGVLDLLKKHFFATMNDIFF